MATHGQQQVFHPAGYASAVDPGAKGAHVFWIDTSVGPPYALKKRNAANTAWEDVGITDEKIQDVVGAMVFGAQGASFVYDDVANSLTLSLLSVPLASLDTDVATQAELNAAVAALVATQSPITTAGDLIWGDPTGEAGDPGSPATVVPIDDYTRHALTTQWKYGSDGVNGTAAPELADGNDATYTTLASGNFHDIYINFAAQRYISGVRVVQSDAAFDATYTVAFHDPDEAPGTWAIVAVGITGADVTTVVNAIADIVWISRDDDPLTDWRVNTVSSFGHAQPTATTDWTQEVGVVVSAFGGTGFTLPALIDENDTTPASVTSSDGLVEYGFEIDLGVARAVQFARMFIDTNLVDSPPHKIYSSDDDVDYTLRHSAVSWKSVNDNDTFMAPFIGGIVTARYWRVVHVADNAAGLISLHTLELRGPRLALTNEATAAKGASASLSSGSSASNMTDSNVVTYATNNYVSDVADRWGRINLGVAKAIAAYRVDQTGYASGYAKSQLFIESSTDNATWTVRDFIDTLLETTGVRYLTGNPVTARYWRIRIAASADTTAWRITNFELYTEAVIPPILAAAGPARLAIGTLGQQLTVIVDGAANLVPAWVTGSGAELDAHEIVVATNDILGHVTFEEIRDQVAALIVGGANISAVHDDIANTLTIAVTGSLGLTTEEVDDRVAALLVGGANISVVYDDVANTVTLAVTGSLGLTTEEVDDRVAALLIGGTGITATYDDVANTLTLTATGGVAPAAHASEHATAGSDPISPASIGASSTAHTHGASAPAAHAASHASGDSDAISPASIGASATGHNHDATYSALGHNHDGSYAALGHTHALPTGIPRIFGGFVTVGAAAILNDVGPNPTADVNMTPVGISGWCKTVPVTTAAQFDIKYKRGGAAWTSIFSVLPTFAVGSNTPTSGTISLASILAGDVFRLDWIAVNSIADVTVQLKANTA